MNDLVIGTYGRGFWVLDDITPLRQIAAHAQADRGPRQAYLFEPEEAIRARNNSNWDQPFSIEVPHAANVPYGVLVDYYLSQEPKAPIQLQVFDAQGNIRCARMTSVLPPPITGEEYPRYWLASPESRALSTHVGENRVNWDLYYDDPPAVRHDLENEMNMTPGCDHAGSARAAGHTGGLHAQAERSTGRCTRARLTVVNDPRAPARARSLWPRCGPRTSSPCSPTPGMQQSFQGHEEVDAVRSQLALVHEGVRCRTIVAAQARTARRRAAEGGRRACRPAVASAAPPPRPTRCSPFYDLNNEYSTMVSMVQVGLDMAPTPTQVATWELDCTELEPHG